MTRCGTCVPPGPSRKVAGWPLTFRDKEGNCERTHSRSSGEEAFSAKADLLCCSVIELSGYEILPTAKSQQPTAGFSSHHAGAFRLNFVDHPLFVGFAVRIL